MTQNDSSDAQEESRAIVPKTAGEALDPAHVHFRPRCRDGTPASLHVQEFDIGHLVHATFPPTEPRSFGGSHLILSKTDGALTFVPNHPPRSAIARYRAERAGNPV